MFENRVLRGIFGPKRKQEVGENNEGLYNLLFTKNYYCDQI
jgi:hypothetical protein